MKKAINEMLEDRIDEASIKVCLNSKFSELENKENELLNNISKIPIEHIKDFILLLENSFNDKITLSEELMYKEGFKDGLKYCFEAFIISNNNGQILDS